MAWDGAVRRRVIAVDLEGPTLHFETCRHQQPWPVAGVPPIAVFHGLLSGGEWICEKCSAPHRGRIRRIQESISFDDVMTKLRKLAEDPGELLPSEPERPGE